MLLFHFQLDGFPLSVVYELKQGRSDSVLQMESNRVVTLDCTEPNQLLVFFFNFNSILCRLNDVICHENYIISRLNEVFVVLISVLTLLLKFPFYT